MSPGRKAFALFVLLAVVTALTWVAVGRPTSRRCPSGLLAGTTGNRAAARRIYADMPARDRLLLAACDRTPG